MIIINDFLVSVFKNEKYIPEEKIQNHPTVNLYLSQLFKEQG